MDIMQIILLALFVEAIIQIFKPIWNKSATQLTVTEWISMGVGVVFAVIAKINMLDGLVPIDSPILLYLLYGMTGLAIGRGPSFLHDLWAKLSTKTTDK